MIQYTKQQMITLIRYHNLKLGYDIPIIDLEKLTIDELVKLVIFFQDN